MKTIRVTIWNEYLHEVTNPAIAAIYPNGIHGAIAEDLADADDLTVRIATLEQPAHGLDAAALDATDVLIWWGHMAHDQVPDQLAAEVRDRVLRGMGFIALHSAHYSKPFRLLMGTSCSLRCRENGEHERLWVTAPGHPVAAGLPPHFVIPHVEMYGEHFDIPTPDELVLIGWFQGGDVFRSGCCFTRGRGRIFYFQPGHETFPIYYQAEVRQVLRNAVRWAAPTGPLAEPLTCVYGPPLEPITQTD